MEFQLPPSREGERSAPLSASSRKNFNSRPFQGKLRGPSGQPARQLNLTASAQGRSGENFAARQTASVPTAPTAPAQGHFRGNFTGMSDCSPVSPTQSHPHRGVPGKTSQGRKLRSIRPSTRSPTSSRPRRAISGEISQACQTARPSAQPNLTRTGVFREKLHRDESRAPSDKATVRPSTAPTAPAQGHFRGNFAARKDSPPVSSTPPHPRRAAPGKTSQAKNHSAADGATLATRPTILVKLRGPLDGATIIHPPVRPGQTSYARKRPPDARPSK